MKFYKCRYCEKFFTNSSARYNHCCVLHFGWRSRCVICEKLFKWRRSAHKHVIKEHVNYAQHHAKYIVPIRFKSKANASWEEYVKKLRKNHKLQSFLSETFPEKPTRVHVVSRERCSACSAKFISVEDLEQHLLRSSDCLESAHICLTDDLCLTENDLKEKPCIRKSLTNKPPSSNASHKPAWSITSQSSALFKFSTPSFQCDISSMDKVVIDKIINDVCCDKERIPSFQQFCKEVEVASKEEQDEKMPEIVKTFSLAKKSVSTLRPLAPIPVGAPVFKDVRPNGDPIFKKINPVETPNLKKISILRAGKSKLYVLAKNK